MSHVDNIGAVRSVPASVNRINTKALSKSDVHDEDSIARLLHIGGRCVNNMPKLGGKAL